MGERVGVKPRPPGSEPCRAAALVLGRVARASLLEADGGVEVALVAGLGRRTMVSCEPASIMNLEMSICVRFWAPSVASMSRT
jgi:hypothetical protein